MDANTRYIDNLKKCVNDTINSIKYEIKTGKIKEKLNFNKKECWK